MRNTHADHTHDGPEDWDRRYADGGHQLWSGAPNGALVAEVDGLPPGTALDVGCGEGADAIWLAQQGWRVTAVDISDVALERARRAAREVGLEVDVRRVELPADPLPGRFDLVSVQYPALRHTSDDAAIHAILGAVALDGTLLVVGHDLRDHEHHPDFDPADYVQPRDVAHHLDDAWVIEVDETRPRTRPPGSPGPDVPDVVLRARRVGPPATG